MWYLFITDQIRSSLVVCQRRAKWRVHMNTAATLSRLFAGIQPELDQVDATFQERATSGLDILNSASIHALGSPCKRLRTSLTLLSGKLNSYCFDKLLPLNIAHEMVQRASLIQDKLMANSFA